MGAQLHSEAPLHSSRALLQGCCKWWASRQAVGRLADAVASTSPAQLAPLRSAALRRRATARLAWRGSLSVGAAALPSTPRAALRTVRQPLLAPLEHTRRNSSIRHARAPCRQTSPPARMRRPPAAPATRWRRRRALWGRRPLHRAPPVRAIRASCSCKPGGHLHACQSAGWLGTAALRAEPPSPPPAVGSRPPCPEHTCRREIWHHRRATLVVVHPAGALEWSGRQAVHAPCMAATRCLVHGRPIASQLPSSPAPSAAAEQGFQTFLTMLGSSVLIPSLLVPAMGGTSEGAPACQCMAACRHSRHPAAGVPPPAGPAFFCVLYICLAATELADTAQTRGNTSPC